MADPPTLEDEKGHLGLVQALYDAGQLTWSSARTRPPCGPAALLPSYPPTLQPSYPPTLGIQRVQTDSGSALLLSGARSHPVPAARLGCSWWLTTRPPNRDSPGVREQLARLGPVLEYVESRRVSTASPVPTSAQFLCSFASTITYGCCYPDDNDVWVNEHEDEDNEDGSAFVLGVFEDERDEHTSGLFYADGQGGRVFMGPGVLEDEFHINRHGVLSTKYGKRFSMVLYPNRKSCLSARFKERGCRVWTTVAQREKQAEKFIKARGPVPRDTERHTHMRTHTCVCGMCTGCISCPTLSDAANHSRRVCPDRLSPARADTLLTAKGVPKPPAVV